MHFRFILFFLFFTHACQAQLFFSFSENIVKSNFKDFHSLAEHGYPALDESFVNLNIGGKYYFKKYAFSAQYSYSFGTDKNQDTKKSAHIIGYGTTLGISRYWLKWKDFQFFTHAKIGAQKYHLKYFAKENRFDFSSAIETFHFSGLGLYEDIDIGLEKLFSLKRSEFAFNAAIGYRFDQRNWKLHDDSNYSKAHHNGLLMTVGLIFRPLLIKKD